MSLLRRLEAVKFAREYRSLISRLFKISPERGDDWDGGLVGDLVRAARAVMGRSLALDRHERSLITRRPWFGSEWDDPRAGWDGLSPPTQELYNAMTVGRLGDPQLGCVTARIDLLINATQRLIDAVAPAAEKPQRAKRARKASSEMAAHAGK